jgi:uncharacterized membrane protein YphA (DoxX/SURF4 family)
MTDSVSELASSICALIIVGIFLWAGLAKLRSRTATTSAFKTLGLPAPGVLALGIPVAEIGISTIMVIRQQIGAALAIGLLGIFSVFLISKLRSGSNVSCGCFGSAQTTPVSWVTIARNAALIGLGLIALTIKPTLAFLDRTASLHIALLTAASTATLIGALIVSVLTMKQDLP